MAKRPPEVIAGLVRNPGVEAIAPALIPHLDKPFAFFGHSVGGLVSFELTHLLKSESSLTPSHLFVSACRAPQLPPTRKPIYNLPESELKAEQMLPCQAFSHPL
jgi:medium-chain acyl-[acyl-carrier-protein] hydrolase